MSWEGLATADQGGTCYSTAYQLQAARQAAGSATWALSGRLGAFQNNDIGHGGVALVDGTSHAAVIDSEYSQPNGGPATYAYGQPAAGAPWSRSAPIPGPVVNPRSNLTVEVGGTDSKGAATLAFVTQANTSAPLSIGVLNGNIVSNLWGTAKVLQQDDFSRISLALAVGSDGKAVLAWSSVTPTFLNYVTLRASSGAAWQTPIRSDAPKSIRSQEYGPSSAAIAAGKPAAVSYPGENPVVSRTDVFGLVKVDP